jgi:hypothetical protein
MAEFASLHSYWDFEQGVKARAGSVREDTELLQGERDEGTKEFLRVVRETSRRRMRKVAKDRTFFRAQRGFTWTTVPLMGEDGRQIEVRDVAAAHPPERMVPLAEKVGAGRASRKGIPCLYLDNRESAAMSEMRPWVGSYITLAQFKMARDCLVVDCSLSTTASHLLEPFSLDEGEPSVSASTKEDGVWGSIGFAFARPVRLDDPRLDYIPTQVLAEEFRSYGFHGIVYKSLLDDAGMNVALFDVNAAKPTACCLYKTVSASLGFALSDDIPFWSCPESISSELRHGEAFTILGLSREGDDAEGG